MLKLNYPRRMYINNICSSFIAFTIHSHTSLYFQCSTALHINNKKDSSPSTFSSMQMRDKFFFFFIKASFSKLLHANFYTFNSSSTFIQPVISQFIKCYFRCLSCFLCNINIEYFSMILTLFINLTFLSYFCTGFLLFFLSEFS